MDILHCQNEIAGTILDADAAYLMPSKSANQPAVALGAAQAILETDQALDQIGGFKILF